MANKVKKILVFTMMLFVGISSVLASTKNISVTNIEVKDKSGTITVVDPVLVSNEVTSNITFNQKDDFVTFELTLKNNESEKYKITSITDNNTNENIKVEYSFNQDFINTGDTSKVTLKLTYKNKLLNVDEISLNDLTITLNLESEEGKEEEIIINPVTGDNIFHYLVLLIIALVGIGLVVAKKKVKGIKVGSFFVVLAVLLLPFAVFANEKYEITIKFDDIKVKGEFETYNISIDPGNGAPVETRQITYGDKIGTLPANPTKDGYTFNKWVDYDGNEVTEDTVITGPIEIIATYNLITYNITYDLDEGSLPSGKSNPTEYTIESQSITLNNPEKKGYTFAGWSGTGIDGQTTEVTIDHGSKGDRSYKAHYLAKDDTKYTVIHKFQKLTEGYDEETVEEHGTTGSTVPAPRKTRTGFITPAVQNVTIEADESASVTYVYDRETYAFSITDRTYVDSTSTADGTYPYGTSITVKVVNRPGYDFKWSDGDTNLERTFTLEEPMNLTPEYTARTDTVYKVIHQKQKITLDGYEIEDTQNLSGTTDSPISPAVNTYEGFTSPQVQSTTINGDGSTVVNYYYTRNQVTVTFTNTEYIEEDVTSGLHYYGEQITLTAKDRDGYTFTGWTNGETSNPLTITVGTSDVSVGPEYTAKTNTPYVVNHYKMNLDGENYTKVEDDTQNLTGTTDATITPAVNSYDGFTSPSTQTTTISGKGDTVVNYYYTRNKYTLTINHPEYLEEDKSGEYYYEEEITLTAIDRQGYTFAGWNTRETTKTITVSMPVDGITEEATYTSNTDTTYSVTHKYKKLTEGYDEVTINGTGTTGDTIEAPLRPQTGFVNPTVQNITITADGQASVTYIYDRETYAFSITDRTYLDSTSTANETYPYGTEITLKAQERTGYTFKWSDDVTDLERTFELTKATTLSLIYTADTYTLTADANEGTIEETTGWTGTGATATKTITYDSTYGTLPTVKRTGYTLDRWNTSQDGNGTDITSATTVTTTSNQDIYAIWTPNTDTAYKVIHKKQNVTLDGYEEIVENLTGTTGALITPTVNTYTGFISPNAETTTIAADGSTEVVYTYNRETYTVSFDTDGGSTVPAQTVAYGAKVTEPSDNPTKEYYNFIDWYTTDSYSTAFDFAETTISGPTIIYAKFEIQTFTVTFDTDGGSTVPAQTVSYGGLVLRPATNPTKTGYTFDDWYTDDTYTTKYDFTTPITGDTTIYANFEELKVCANNENITTLSENTCSNNENITVGNGIVCKRAVKLHEETCSQTNTSAYCSGAGYTESGSKGTSTITYGSCGTSGTLTSGDAFTCDVNGDEKFDELTERFYYVSDYYDTSAKKFDDSTAVLIYYNNVTSGVSCNRNTFEYSTQADIQAVDPSRTDYDNWHGPLTVMKQLPTTSQWSNVSLKSDTRAILAEYQSTHDSPTTAGGTLPTDFSYEGYAARLLTAKELMAGCNLTEVGRFTKGELDSCNYIMENTKYAKSSIGSYGGWLETPRASDSFRAWNVYGSDRFVSYDGAIFINSCGARPAIEVPKSKIEYGASSTYTVTLNANGGSVSPTSITVNIGDAIGTLPTPTAPTGKSFTGWYTELTGGIEVTSLYVPNTDIEIYARYNNTYAVSFDTDGGTEIPSQTIEEGGKVTKPADPTKTGYVFDDWYTDDTYKTKFDFENTAITEDTTIYAKFDELKTCADNENITRLSENTCSNNENITVGDGIVCKRAVKLHEETCSQTDGTYYCSGAGYTESGSKGTSTITYGSCGTSGTLSSGDAFTCDVNGDGDFDELTERFYYVSDYYDTSAKGFDTSTAVLIYYNNVTSGVSCNKNTFAYDSSNENWHGPRTLVSQLPTTSQWSNVSLKSDTRAILSEYQSTHDSPTTGGETLPTNFSYEGYAARLLTAKELMSGCNLTEVGIKTTGELDSCDYIMENTRYAKSTIGSAGHWLETPYAFDTYSVWYVGGYYHSVHSSSTNNSNFGSARPVIEVPKTAIDIGSLPQYTVTFNSDGGSTIADIKVDAGDSINELPTPTKADSVFVGWFESVTDENPVTEPYTPSGDITLIAKWNNIICKKATDLHEVTCAHTDGGKGCRKNHSQGNYTYGNIIDSDTFESGDVLDCDVDGTGYNQRFYYMRTIDDKAVLISYTDFEGDSGQGNTQSYKYATALTKLPTTTQWDNLPVTFESGTQAARLMTYDDLKYACGNGSAVTDSDLVNCEYIFENSGYESTTTGRNGTWIAESGGTYRRIQNAQVIIETPSKGADSENTVKPVIEVPTDLIEDAYIVKFNANGGNSTPEYVKVIKGTSLGTLPTATRTGYIFDGWYTSLDYTIPVIENTVPNGYVTYYAKWTGDISDASFAHDSFILSVGDEDDIVINNSSDYESVTYTSNDTSIVTVNNSGHLTAVADGETTITVTGSRSGHTRTINVKVTEEITEFVVHFDSMGGSSVNDMNVPINTAIGSLPEDPILADNIFAGWYTNTNYSTKVTTDTVIRSDVTFYAKWIPENAVAEINHTYFTSLQSAFDSEMTGKTTIILLKDISVENTYLDLYTKNFGKDIVLDLNGHTITGSGKQTLRTKTSLEVKNGTITQSSSNGTIDVGSGGHLIMNNGTVINTGSRAAIYNEGGIVELGGTVNATSNAQWVSNNQRGTVQNKAGTTIITGGTYINTRSSDSYAVSATVGTLTIGTKDDIYNTTNIVLQGETSGIYSAVDYSIYDGMIRGKSSAVNNESKITSIEDNATKVNDVDGDYNILYYTVPNNKYRIDLDAGEGTVDPTYILVDAGDQLGTLPTPTRGVYTFDGWFDANDVEADPTHEPTSSETYYAKWHYEASNEIVEFRTTNDAMAEYYDKIETWKVSSANFPSWSSSNKSPDWALDATENTAMKNNFDANNCQCADGQCSSSGTVACDKPKGYSTGLNEKVNVYLSDAVTKAKGDLVTYAKANNGIIYNLIPGEVYYWESDNDENIHGYVKFTGERRILDTGDVRNTRDLGGLPVDTDDDNIPDGELKYGKLFRGIKLNSSSSVTELANLGITEELDLRESNSDPYKLSDIEGKKYHRIEAQNYYVNYNPDNATEMGYYNMTRAAVKYAMEEIVNGENLYFHCRIGADRTGTVAYVLEGLLGVPEEDRVQDYELSFFYGLIRIHRYHNEKPGSSVGTGKERFVYMHNFMPTNSDIYDWYMAGSDDPTGDADLINRFRTAMIDTN